MSPQKVCDFVFANGRIYTVNEDQPWAQAVAVAGNKIIYVGDNDGAQACVRADTESIDLGAVWPATRGGFKDGVNPFNSIYVAMHRRLPKHLSEEFASADRTRSPEEKVLILAEAIQGYTINGAKLLGREDEIGSIEVRKKADLILLSQNLFEINAEDIPKTKVPDTLFDGRILRDLLYGIGDSDLVDLDEVEKGTTGPCRYEKKTATITTSG